MPGYLTKLETFAVGGLDTRIRSLLDRQQFSDPDGAAARAGISSAGWPLFGLVWPSALVLAAQMQHIALDGRRVLEVGCGLALASLVLLRRDGDVTASDRHPLAEFFLLENLRLNALPALTYRHGDWAGRDASLGRFGLIIGSDVLYEPDQPALLAGFIAAHAEPRCEVIVVDPDRGNRGAFHREMAALGFARSECKVDTLPGGVPYRGRVLGYRRGAAGPVTERAAAD
jgi:predicted nicotinamide N-methyase